MSPAPCAPAAGLSRFDPCRELRGNALICRCEGMSTETLEKCSDRVADEGSAKATGDADGDGGEGMEPPLVLGKSEGFVGEGAVGGEGSAEPGASEECQFGS